MMVVIVMMMMMHVESSRELNKAATLEFINLQVRGMIVVMMMIMVVTMIMILFMMKIAMMVKPVKRGGKLTKNC